MKIAIADIGSNTVKMTVFDEDNNIVFKKSKPVGLIGYIKDGILSEEGITLLTDTLAAYYLLALKQGADTLYPFATASLRAAENSDEVITHVKRTLALTVDLVSGEEEAALSLAGVSLAGDVTLENALLLDMGGGSCEVISKEKALSFPIGSLALFRRFVSGILPTKEELTRVYGYVKGLIATETLPHGRGELLAVGGTLRAFCQFHAAVYGKSFSEERPYTVTREELVRLLTLTCEKSLETRMTLIRLIPERMHTFATGLTAVLALADTLGKDRFTVVSGGAREGYLMKIRKTLAEG